MTQHGKVQAMSYNLLRTSCFLMLFLGILTRTTSRSSWGCTKQFCIAWVTLSEINVVLRMRVDFVE
ncbi:unnamed protein product [Cylicocyclus nassatus]|uniref:Uncharacterized protein n=1 Tax=Cylicocyclus nassatus TaxID=53992 RepID=A0AA36GK93_CYLNA|nr:unnamed protein product [Cylicocyclus nassatus]